MLTIDGNDRMTADDENVDDKYSWTTTQNNDTQVVTGLS